MKPSKLLAIFVVLLVGIGTCLVLRQRCLAGFRAESRRLREHTREVEWLRAENESLQRQATSAKTAKITTEEISELMRLRSEAGRLRVELGEELRKSASTNDQLIADLSATEDARKPDEWSDLGAATPTAALQTVFGPGIRQIWTERRSSSNSTSKVQLRRPWKQLCGVRWNLMCEAHCSC
jgi:hypothetical protein